MWYNIQDIDEVIEGRKEAPSAYGLMRDWKKSGNQTKPTSWIVEVEKKCLKTSTRVYGIVIDAEKAHSAHGTPELKITYHFNKDDLKTRIIEFYPYDEGSCSLVLDGDMESEFLVYHKRVDWVFSSLDELIAGHNRDE